MSAIRPSITPDAADGQWGAADFDVANRLFFRLYQSSNLMHKTGTRFVAEFGATTQQWAVLGALARPAVQERGATIKELMALLLLSRQSLTPVVDRLEQRGLVERVKDEADGRNRRLLLTAEGRRIWADMLVQINAYYEAALDGFDTEERVMLYRLLDRLKDRLADI